MAKSLKINGMNELVALRNRVKRQYGYGRITKADADYLVTRLNEVEAKIVNMQEKSPDLPEESFG